MRKYKTRDQRRYKQTGSEQITYEFLFQATVFICNHVYLIRTIVFSLEFSESTSFQTNMSESGVYSDTAWRLWRIFQNQVILQNIPTRFHLLAAPSFVCILYMCYQTMTAFKLVKYDTGKV